MVVAQDSVFGENVHCTSPSLLLPSLLPGVVSLIKDLNGNHVVQRCLQRLGPADSQFIYDAAGANCVEIASHRHGCCVLQRCIDYATSAQKTALVEKIAASSLILSQVRRQGSVMCEGLRALWSMSS